MSSVATACVSSLLPPSPDSMAASSNGKERESTRSFSAVSASSASGLMRTSESWKEWKPVPAGTRCPRMTFSFSPTKRSTFPESAASVSTFVVSWKLAAEIKLLLCTDAFVIPNNWVLAVAGLGFEPLATSPPNASICALACCKASLGTTLPKAYSLSPISVILTQSARPSLCWRNSNLSNTFPRNSFVSPADSILTLRSI